MPRFKSSVFANVLGAGWVAMVQLACIPLFVRLMGLESYGLVGFYLALQMALQALDLGLGLTANRELARRDLPPADLRDLLRTMETVYWTIGAAIAAGVLLLAPLLAEHWIKARNLSPEQLGGTLRIMALALACQWPFSFYQNCLNGLQRQLLFNLIRGAGVAVLNGGAVLALSLNPSVTTFFVWQLVVSAAQALALAAACWRCMPSGERPARLDFSQLRRIRVFAGGVGSLTVVGTLVGQMDKLVLSAMLPLEQFACYTLGGTVASSLQLFVTPIFSAIFPRLSRLAAEGDEPGERALYHAGTQLMAVLVIPTAVVLAVFGPQAIGVWTGNPVLARQVAPLAAGLLVGTAINGLMHLPYALQLAHGWTSMNLRLGLAKAVLFPPLLLWGVVRYGALGGALAWTVLNLLYLAVGAPLTHRRLMRHDLSRWLGRDVGAPLLAVLAAVTICRVAIHPADGGLIALAQVLVAAVIALLAAALAAPEVRGAVSRSLGAFRGAEAE